MDILGNFLEFIALLLLNAAAGALGFIPSFLLTGINVSSFGIIGGTVISLTGEIMGAVVGFYLYRFGFSKVQPAWKESRFWNFMRNQRTISVFFSILLFRLLPFVPSGLVTAGAALTTIRAFLFFIASSLGKIPAVLIEVAAVYGFIQVVPVAYQYAAVLLIVGIMLFIKLRKRKKESVQY